MKEVRRRRRGLEPLEVDDVPRDAVVVGRGVPVERDRRRRLRRGREVTGHGRSAPVRDAHRLVHVGLDLARAQGLVVDADVVDEPVEEAARRAAVGPDPPDVGVAHSAGELARRDLRAVDVEAGGRAVEGCSKMLPLAVQRTSARVEIRPSRSRPASGGSAWRGGQPRSSGPIPPMFRPPPRRFSSQSSSAPRPRA